MVERFKVRADHVSVFFGRKGTGKSELARYFFFLMRASLRVCIDVKDDLGDKMPGVPTIHSPTDVLDYQTVRIVPPDPDDEAFYDELFRILFERGDCLVWWDEIDAATSPNRIPKYAKIYVVRGRSRKCGLLGCTTRPANTHPAFASQADHVFVHRIEHPLDRKTISGLVDIDTPELADELDDLESFGFLHRDVAAGELVASGPVHDPDVLTAEISKLYFGPYDPRA